MIQTRSFNFVVRLLDYSYDGDMLYYFYHKFERNKDVDFDKFKVFLDRFHDNDVSEEYYKECENILIKEWNNESYNIAEGYISDEEFNKMYKDNFDINEVEY